MQFVNPHLERTQRLDENRKLVQALHNIQPAIDNKEPQRYPHLSDNKKREWLLDMEYAKIERENAILLERLCMIARPRSLYIKPKTFQPGVAIDHHLRPVIDNVESSWGVPGGSLNAVSRRRELLRVMADNQSILERIWKSKGRYSAERWRQEGKQQQQYAEIRRKQPGPASPAQRPHTSPAPLPEGWSFGKPHSPERVYGCPTSPNTARGARHDQRPCSQGLPQRTQRPITAVPQAHRPVTAH
eukprot:jgi/Astpho2/3033/fgenesh1_pg.00051_%23_45_t